MLETIITGVIAAVGSVVVSIFTGRRDSKAEAEKEIAEGRLHSSVEVGRVERAMRKPIEVEPPKTPDEWNAGVGRIAGLLMAVVLITGCGSTSYVQSPWPLIEVPDRPVLDTTEPFSEREQQIVRYANGLEVRILRYNEAAKAHNEQHGYDR